MSITTLNINNLRNIVSAHIACSPYFNLFFGDNAAGKTSVLEAIYYLSSGRSFRSTQHNHVIHRDQFSLTLFAELLEGDFRTPIGLQRSRDGLLQIRLNEENAKSIADITRQLPVQFISADSHYILSDGPKCRRQFIDWGLFHTNPLFFQEWKVFQKLLIQRNAALKARAPQNELLIWNSQFAAAAEKLNHLRKEYLNNFLPYFNEIILHLLGNTFINSQYYAGWDENIALIDCLNQYVSRETMVGHSIFGPHRADLLLSSEGMPVEDVLSQGQQKLVSYAMRLSQGMHFQAVTKKSPIYLIDDLPSELDQDKRSLVTQILSNLNAQVFITGIESSDLAEILALNRQNKMFHVKHGEIVEFVQQDVSRETYIT